MPRPFAKELVEVGDVVIGEEPVFCACVGEDDPYELLDVAEEACSVADLVELRIDLLDDPQDGDVKRQLANTAFDSPLILTVRKKSEGGDFHGDERDRARLYRELMDFVDAIDLEYHMPDRFREEVVQKAKENNVTKLFSYHNFSRTGSVEEIKIRLEECLELGDLAKVVTKPDSSRDVLKLFNASLHTKESLGKPFACFGLGDVGRHSRVVSVFYGSDIVYGAAREAVAPGQFGIREARDLYSLLR